MAGLVTIVIILIIALILCFGGLIYLFFQISEMLVQEKAKDREFFSDVMNRLMSENADEYAYLSGDYQPQEDNEGTEISEEAQETLDELTFEEYKERTKPKK